MYTAFDNSVPRAGVRPFLWLTELCRSSAFSKLFIVSFNPGLPVLLWKNFSRSWRCRLRCFLFPTSSTKLSVVSSLRTLFSLNYNRPRCSVLTITASLVAGVFIHTGCPFESSGFFVFVVVVVIVVVVFALWCRSW